MEDTEERKTSVCLVEATYPLDDTRWWTTVDGCYVDGSSSSDKATAVERYEKILKDPFKEPKETIIRETLI